MTRFGAVVRELRMQRGWSQVELARATGKAVSASLVSAIESGSRGAGHDTVDALADALGVSAKVRGELHAARKADRAATAVRADPAPRPPTRAEAALDVVSLAGLTAEQRARVLGYIDALRQEGRG